MLLEIDQIQEKELTLELGEERKGPWDTAFFEKLEGSLRDVIWTFLARNKT